MGIYKNKIKRRVPGTNTIERIEIPKREKPAPKWMNPTAYVIARRDADGKLSPVYADAVNRETDREQLTQIAACLIGSLYMVERELFERGENLRIVLSTDKQFRNEASATGEALHAKRFGQERNTDSKRGRHRSQTVNAGNIKPEKRKRKVIKRKGKK